MTALIVVILSLTVHFGHVRTVCSRELPEHRPIASVMTQTNGAILRVFGRHDRVCLRAGTWQRVERLSIRVAVHRTK